MPHRNLFAILGLALLLGGCAKPNADPKPPPVEQPLQGVKLRLAVVDDPAMAAAIARMQGEWNSQTGSELEVVQLTEKELDAAKAMPADAVVCPSHWLGTLAQRDWLVPVPREILRNAEWTGLFELLKLREAAWGSRTMAIPFGSPVFCCYYRVDLLEKLGRKPPRTWEEYQELAELLAKNDPRLPAKNVDIKAIPWCGSIEPLAPGWAGLTLLARAAPSLKHRNNYSALFRIETMEPQVAGKAMIAALEELVATAKLSPVDLTRCDPTAVRAAFWRGQCGMALTWPTAARGLAAASTQREADENSEASTLRMGVVELPGSKRAYNLNRRTWDKRSADEDAHVPLLAIAGRLGVVGKNAANAQAAFQLLLWLSDDRRSPQISPASPATTMFRQSNLQFPDQWVEKSMPADAAVQYGAATAAAFQHEAWLGALRMPGRAEYLAALDEAVLSAVRGEKSPADALEKAEKKWRDITDRLGLDRQRAAYHRSLGLE